LATSIAAALYEVEGVDMITELTTSSDRARHSRSVEADEEDDSSSVRATVAPDR